MKRSGIITLMMAFVISASMISVSAAEPHWEHNSNGWWYDNGDGTWPAKTFKDIDGKTYYFNSQGYMVTGWQSLSGLTCYFKSSGEMAASEWIDGTKWIDCYGALVTNSWVDNGRYYVDGNGNWDPSKGARSTAWRHNSRGWWFDYGDGSYARATFLEVDKSRYFFDLDGYMVTGWYQIGGSGGTWCYFGDNGMQRFEQWIGDYYVNEFGYMAINEWIDSTHYVGWDGKLIPSYGTNRWVQDSTGWMFIFDDETKAAGKAYTIAGKAYRFNDNGYLYMSWYQTSDGVWHYSDPSTGEMYTSRWAGNYWLDANGNMAVNQWVDGGKYYVGPDGKWIPNYPKS